MIPVMAHKDGSYKFNSWRGIVSRGEVVDHAEQILEDVGLIDKRHIHSGSLSRGDKRRLELAMCLAQDPELLLLDEPTAGMARADTNNTIDLLQKIGAERNITKVIIEHDMHVVFSLATRVSVLARGHVIAEGAPQEMKGDPRVQEAYLGGAHL
jgi:branched-chain amino acid transport system ATP-binding protein